jgi:Lhr-like helicase
VPTLTALLIESVTLQSCMEYFVHTPLPRSANEAIVRVLLHRWRRTQRPAATALVADLGFYLVVHEAVPMSPDGWRDGMCVENFTDDLREHLQDNELLRLQFARVSQTGLMVLRNPAGRKRKVGGKDWSQRRLFEQIRNRAPDFVLLRQAEREALSSACDLAQALVFVERLASMQIRVRRLPLPSPFGESLLRVGFPSTPVTSEPAVEFAEVS